MSREKLEISSDSIKRGLPMSSLSGFGNIPKGDEDANTAFSCLGEGGCGAVVMGEHLGTHVNFHALIANLVDGVYQVVQRTGGNMDTQGKAVVDFKRVEL